MPDDHQEPQRVFGVPVGSGRPVIVEDEEQRVLGMPVRWIGPIGQDAHRVLKGIRDTIGSWLRRGR